MRRADQHGDSAGRLCDPGDRPAGGAHEAGPEQQILGRIARHDELREENEIGADVAGPLEPFDDAGRVAVDVPDDAIDLGECESHRFSPLGRKLYHAAPAGRFAAR